MLYELYNKNNVKYNYIIITCWLKYIVNQYWLDRIPYDINREKQIINIVKIIFILQRELFVNL